MTLGLASPAEHPTLDTTALRRPARRWPALADLVDAVLEASIVGSFSRVGFVARSRLEKWPVPPRLDGRVVVVTGASSGIGRAAALALARLGAILWLVGREPERTAEVADAARHVGTGGAEAVALDVVDAEAVAGLCQRIGQRHDRVDALVHGAGALLSQYRQAPDGSELTVATHVLAPYRLTIGLSSFLRRAGRSTVVTMSSGGMYAESFDLDRLEMSRSAYDGVRAYARAKRAQVVLAHEWARRWGSDGVASYAMHPGWVATPGLAVGLPSFARLGPLLRTPAQGADTVVWLAADAPRREPAAPGSTTPPGAGFWLDRRPRSEYRCPGARPPAGTEESQGARLWEWCAARTGVTPPGLPGGRP